MNFVSEHGKMEDQEGIAKSLKKLQLNEDERLMTIVIENESIVCDMKILQQECDYFKALERFKKDNQSSIELKGEIDYDTLKIIYEYLLGGKLKIDLYNFQILLQGCLFFNVREPKRQQYHSYHNIYQEKMHSAFINLEKQCYVRN